MFSELVTVTCFGNGVPSFSQDISGSGHTYGQVHGMVHTTKKHSHMKPYVRKLLVHYLKGDVQMECVSRFYHHKGLHVMNFGLTVSMKMKENMEISVFIRSFYK